MLLRRDFLTLSKVSFGVGLTIAFVQRRWNAIRRKPKGKSREIYVAMFCCGKLCLWSIWKTTSASKLHFQLLLVVSDPSGIFPMSYFSASDKWMFCRLHLKNPMTAWRKVMIDKWSKVKVGNISIVICTWKKARQGSGRGRKTRETFPLPLKRCL